MSLGSPTSSNKRGLPSSDSTNKPAGLEKRPRVSHMDLVVDDIGVDKHDAQDAELLQTFGSGTGFKPPWHLLLSELVRLCGEMNQEYTDTVATKNLLETSPYLKKELIDAWDDKSLSTIRLMRDLRREPPQERSHFIKDLDIKAQEIATELSWTHAYVGQASDALWTHIRSHFKHDKKAYAHYCSIVQSSGMGKSRVVENLSLTHFVIPINLRHSDDKGFPPPDSLVRDFLSTNESPHSAYTRACAFMKALFEETASTLETLGPSESLEHVTRKFKDFMNQGISMDSHGEQRQNFYRKVVEAAREFVPRMDKHLRDLYAKPPPTHGSIHVSPSRAKDFLPAQAFAKLRETILNTQGSPTPSAVSRQGTHPTTRSSANEAKPAEEEPYVILEFDEAHTLTLRQGAAPLDWSNFSELRRALRSLYHSSLFTLFLSTTGKITLFVSSKDRDLSTRIMEGELHLIEPFTNLGFDQLAIKIKEENSEEAVLGEEKWTLNRVVTDNHICHYGRPMFGARYDHGDEHVRKQMIEFAALKLLGGTSYNDEMILTDAMKLACLAQRLPIEFNSCTYTQQVKEMEQIEGHMRVCLKIDPGFESMQTVSASEPLLSEAAYVVMSNENFDAPNAFKMVLQGYSINKGDRGELLTLFILTLARDAAVGPPVNRWQAKQRWNSIPQLLGNLFRHPTSPSTPHFKHIDVLKMNGTTISPNGISAYKHSIQKEFANSAVYVTHWIKVHEHRLLTAEYLLGLLARGAGMLCANGHPGIDFVKPFLLKGLLLSRENLSTILGQVKTDSKFTDTPDLSLFDKMDPFALGLFGVGGILSTAPIIRIVFAFAAKTPSLQLVRVQTVPAPGQPDYVTYDIWCSGLSPDILAPVSAQKVDVWDALLQASYGWDKLYQMGDKTAQNIRRSMNPGAASQDAHWKQWYESRG